MQFRMTTVVAVSLLLGAALAPAPAQAQALSQSVMALYPPETGEVVFVDLQVARRSPHFNRLKEQVLPERFRDLERLSAQMGVDFNRNVDRISYAFVSTTGDPVEADFVGVAEGAFELREAQRMAVAQKLVSSDIGPVAVYVLGRNDRGNEFVFAFRDNATLLFGFRNQVEAMLERAGPAGGGAGGGSSLLDNADMRDLINDVNRAAPIWMALNGEFTQLAVRQFLGQEASLPGVESMTERVRNATIRITLNRSLDSTMSTRCASATDALWFSGLLQTALYFQRQRLNSENPTLARVIGEAKLERTGDRISLGVSIPESDLAALVNSNSFTVRF